MRQFLMQIAVERDLRGIDLSCLELPGLLLRHDEALRHQADHGPWWGRPGGMNSTQRGERLRTRRSAWV